MQEKPRVDISLMRDDKSTGHFTPVVDLKQGVAVDYDTKEQVIYWTEVQGENQWNGTLFKTRMGGGEKTNFFDEVDTGLVGSPYSIAFDWVARNMYIGNVEASEISLVQVDGQKFRYRMLVLDNNGDENGVSQPISIVVHPTSGTLFWLDRGGKGVPAKIGTANMDGSLPKVLVKDLQMPETLAIDLQKEILYFSSSKYPAKVCKLSGFFSN